jgi:hypothetical protein
MEERVVEVSGHVMREIVNAGSKSERGTVVLKANDGRTYTLRLRDQPAFGGSGLDHLVGSSITTQGIAIDQTLIMQRWKVD